LEAHGLRIGYGQKKQWKTVAGEIDFTLLQGELAAIVGINGIGKSTLLRTLGRVQPKLDGGIFLDGLPIDGLGPLALASKISMVLTEPLASKNLAVWELLALGRQPYTNWLGTLASEDRSKIALAIELVGIGDLQYKKCYELSDGQLQKVMIARALAQDTSIILLDEPTSHLDLYHKVQILKLLGSIAHETQKTVLFTTHEIEIAIQLCDKMLVMDREECYFGQPCELILQGCFQKLFPADTIVFDPDTGSFKVKK
tara:strand:+ start:37593 stop:38360 length:768 start_codon:yes stop_codon:yes gene_type:complete